jgi:hypothetical protein
VGNDRPQSQLASRVLTFVDEVWASSSFLHSVYSNLTEKTVTLTPVDVPLPKKPVGFGALFGSKFTFLCVFDFNSRIEGKEPNGCDLCISSRFSQRHENVQLILKTVYPTTSALPALHWTEMSELF